VLVVVVASLAWCGLWGVVLAVSYVEYCTGYPVVDCGPISIPDVGWLLVGWSLLGLIPSSLLVALVYSFERGKHELGAHPRIA
jgi:hypothetical protein